MKKIVYWLLATAAVAGGFTLAGVAAWVAFGRPENIVAMTAIATPFIAGGILAGKALGGKILYG